MQRKDKGSSTPLELVLSFQPSDKHSRSLQCSSASSASSWQSPCLHSECSLHPLCRAGSTTKLARSSPVLPQLRRTGSCTVTSMPLVLSVLRTPL